MISSHLKRVCAISCLVCGASVSSHAQTKPSDPLDALGAAVAAAENALRGDEREIAESQYRTAIRQGWMILGAISVADGRLEDARAAFQRAAAATVDTRAPLQAVAVLDLQMGDARAAVDQLTRLAASRPADLETRRLLAEALFTSGQPGEAVQTLEEAHASAPGDPEIAFALAVAYLRVKKTAQAEALFARVADARPLPQTFVLIGRAYRDFDVYDRARMALRRALQMNPRTPHAHYYLGTIIALADGTAHLDEAAAEFRQELAVSPGDPLASLRLGIALVETRHYTEALPALETATRAKATIDGLLFLGRCQLALGRPQDAIASFRRTLEMLPRDTARDDPRLGTLHYQLALALRQSGDEAGAAQEFAEAQTALARKTESAREQLARYMADKSAAPGESAVVAPAIDLPSLDGVPPPRRAEIASRARTMVARAYLNLGILQAQRSRFAQAAARFEDAASLDPDFPQVQYSLGVAYFSAQQFEKALAPFTRALEHDPQNTDARRMLALSAFNSSQFERAADLLASDPQREQDPSLQYMYGVALVRGGRSEEAERIFSRLLAQHANIAELHVVLGQAQAQRGDYDLAVRELNQALALKADVPDAKGALGVIYLKQGRLAEAAAALRSEVAAHPQDASSRYNLATVLDLDGHPDEALAELRTLVKARPTHADARYLMGKIFLARGDASAAVEQLEIAVRLSPDEANIRYQLGQAYQKLGRPELAAQQFEAFQRLKEKRRGGGS